MPTYVAFLRAINLGAKRKFPKDAIRAAVETAGGTEVETHINTGNVRLRSTMRSRTKVETALEEAFLADRGFEVPTMVFAPAEILAIVDDAERLTAEHGPLAGQYVSLFKEAPSAEAVRALGEAEYDGEQAFVIDRAAHLLLHRSYHLSKMMSGKPFTGLGVGTSRNLKVIRAIAQKWC